MPPNPPVWLITGCSSGFGHSLALHALRHNHKVIATARTVSKLDPSLKAAGASILTLDVTSPLETLKDIVASAHSIHNRIDVLVNNAGFLLDGAMEETSPEETYRLFDTNVFGVMNLTRAVVPYMRDQKGGGVVGNISSAGAWRGAAGSSIYRATKAALSTLSEGLVEELGEFGIKVCCIEPGYFESRFLAEGNRITAGNLMTEYGEEGLVRKTMAWHGQGEGGGADPDKGAEVIVDVLTREDVPARLVLGGDAWRSVKGKCERTLKMLDEWKDVSLSTEAKASQR